MNYVAKHYLNWLPWSQIICYFIFRELSFRVYRKKVHCAHQAVCAECKVK